jgi:uncharacterized protein (TIGR02271 family)
MPTLHEIQNWTGEDAVGPDGEKVGTFDHVYVDRETGEPTFAAIKSGLLNRSVSIVPIEGAQSHEGHVQLAFDKAKVEGAPNVDADSALGEAEEAQLYEYYGISGYSQYEGPDHETITARDGNAPPSEVQPPREVDAPEPAREPVGRDTSGPTTDDAMTRSEEQLRVGTQSREVGKARLRKYIVTEHVTTTVPVQREEVRIEREPITDANVGDALDGPALSEEEHEVTLRAETPVVEKDVVAKERVRLDKDTVTEEVQVDESVRKEQIEADAGIETDRRV